MASPALVGGTSPFRMRAHATSLPMAPMSLLSTSGLTHSGPVRWHRRWSRQSLPLCLPAPLSLLRTSGSYQALPQTSSTAGSGPLYPWLLWKPWPMAAGPSGPCTLLRSLTRRMTLDRSGVRPSLLTTSRRWQAPRRYHLPSISEHRARLLGAFGAFFRISLA